MDQDQWRRQIANAFGDAIQGVPFSLVATLPKRDLASVRPLEVRLGPDRIEWRSWDTTWEPGSLADVCLFNFLPLADEDDPNAFLEFATHDGVLGLTRDGLPGSALDEDCPRVEGDQEWGYESIEAWRAYANNARTLLCLAMALRRKSRIDPYDVLGAAGYDVKNLTVEAAIERALDGPHEPPYWDVSSGRRDPRATYYSYMMHFTLPGPGWIERIAECEDLVCQRVLLTQWLMDVWIKRASIDPAIDWSGANAQLPRFTFTLHRRPGYPRESLHSAGPALRPNPPHTAWPENGLFSVLAVELAGLMCSDRHVARCEWCGRLYQAKKAQTHQANYCERCRPDVRRATNRASAKKRYHQKSRSRIQA